MTLTLASLTSAMSYMLKAPLLLFKCSMWVSDINSKLYGPEQLAALHDCACIGLATGKLVASVTVPLVCPFSAIGRCFDTLSEALVLVQDNLSLNVSHHLLRAAHRHQQQAQPPRTAETINTFDIPEATCPTQSRPASYIVSTCHCFF